MNTVTLLFLTGLLFLGVEVFVPGAILGLMGGAMLVGGCVMAFIEFGPAGGFIAVAAALLLTGLLLWFEFKILPRTAIGRRLFLHAQNHGRSQPDVAEPAAVVGREAEVLTALAPTGYVAIDGRRYEAFSRTGFVERGARVAVVGVDTFRLIVQLSETNQPSSHQL